MAVIGSSIVRNQVPNAAGHKLIQTCFVIIVGKIDTPKDLTITLHVWVSKEKYVTSKLHEVSSKGTNISNRCYKR